MAAVITILLMLAPNCASGSGAAYPVSGREPIEVLADQTRDAILERRSEICAAETCPSTTPAWADDIRQSCLVATRARHPHGIGGEDDLVACMERKSGFSLDNPVSADQGEPEAAEPDEVRAEGLGASGDMIKCQERDGSYETRERGTCLASGGAVVERVQ